MLPYQWRQMPAVRRDVLLTVAAEHPITGNDINRALDRKPTQSGSVNAKLRKLRDAGYVTVEVADGQHPNAKGNSLTAEGEHLISQVQAVWEDLGIQQRP